MKRKRTKVDLHQLRQKIKEIRERALSEKTKAEYEYVYYGKPFDMEKYKQDGDIDQLHKIQRKYVSEDRLLRESDLLEALENEVLTPFVRWCLEESLAFTRESGFMMHVPPRRRRRTRREMALVRKSNFVLIEKGKPGRPKKEATA